MHLYDGKTDEPGEGNKKKNQTEIKERIKRDVTHPKMILVYPSRNKSRSPLTAHDSITD